MGYSIVGILVDYTLATCPKQRLFSSRHYSSKNQRRRRRRWGRRIPQGRFSFGYHRSRPHFHHSRPLFPDNSAEVPLG